MLCAFTSVGSILSHARDALFAELALGPGSLADGPGVVAVGVARVLDTLSFSSSLCWISSVTSSSTP